MVSRRDHRFRVQGLGAKIDGLLRQTAPATDASSGLAAPTFAPLPRCPVHTFRRYFNGLLPAAETALVLWRELATCELEDDVERGESEDHGPADHPLDR